MAYNYGFSEIGNRLVALCRRIPPDFDEIRRILSSGIDLNESKSDPFCRSLLGEIMMFYSSGATEEEMFDNGESNTWRTLKYLPDIIRLFLDCGYDPRRDNGAFGGECLNALWLGARDEYALDALAVLLDGGADPGYNNDGETILEETSFECFFWWCEGKYYLAALLAAMERMMELCIAGKDHHQVGMYEHCIGKKLTGVFLYDEKEPPGNFYTCGSLFKRYRHCHKGGLVFLCEDTPLYVTQYRDVFTDKTIDRSDPKVCRDVSPSFKRCIGQTIADITLHYPSVKKDGITYGQSTVILHLSNGQKIRCTTNNGEVPRDKITAYYNIR